MFNQPLAYFITFRAYGTWLHGDHRGSVDRVRNGFGTPMIAASERRVQIETRELQAKPVEFDEKMRTVIEQTIIEVCEHRGWRLLVVNARSNHVHVVVSAQGPPEPVMNSFKSWATRRLIEAGLFDRGAKVWSRHGSTVYLFTQDKVAEKCRYVRDGQ
jgi:REP element-mobilizing transposase RayT